VAEPLSQCDANVPIQQSPQPYICTLSSLLSSAILAPESRLHLVVPPIHLNLALIHILIDSLHPLANTRVLPLTHLKHLEHQISADTWIVCIAKVLVHTLLERFNTLA
jgi:hypothetical protein